MIPNSTPPSSFKITTEAIAASLVVSGPINETWSVFARVGAGFPKTKYTATSNGQVVFSNSETTAEVLYGGGISLSLKRAKLRLEYQDLDKTGLVSVGVVVPIGK